MHNPEVVGQLKSVAQNDADAKVKAAAAAVVKKLERSQSFYSGIETLYFGISLGSILVLAGIGLAITFGVMGVINVAHGEMMMLGAYTTFVMQNCYRMVRLSVAAFYSCGILCLWLSRHCD